MELIKYTVHEDYMNEFQIALVDEPAIESDWQKFSKQQQFQIQDEEKRIVSGYAMIADKKIPRWDEKTKQGFLVVFDKQAITDIALKFFKNGLNTQTNEMHQTGKFAEGVWVFESIIIDRQRGTLAPNGFKQEADGSWFISMKVDNEEVWEKVKKGEYKGFSIECRFKEEKVKADINELMRELELTCSNK